jgi:transposase
MRPEHTPQIVMLSIFADETVVPVLDPGRGRTKQGYFWAIARDDRPWGGSLPPAVVYSYAPGRGHRHANTLLGGYRGILQCDGYQAYKNLAWTKSAEPAVTLAFCWSHVRRGFLRSGQDEGTDSDGNAAANCGTL